MKKLLLCGLILSATVLTGQFAFAEISSVNPETTQGESAKKSLWLGIWIEKLPVSLNRHFSSMLQEHQGLIIKKVSPGSPADKAGLLAYDIIAKINDETILSEQQLVKIIQNSQAGTKVTLGIIRQGKLLSEEAIVEASPNQNAGTKPFPGQNWMKDPFSMHPFKHRPQQFNQHQYQQRLHFSHKQKLKQRNGWSQFESMQIESTNDKLRAEVRYDDSKGNKKEFIFEGDPDEIHKQIIAQEEMDEGRKQSLLQALDVNNAPPLPFGPHGFMGPGRFNRHSPMPGWFQR